MTALLGSVLRRRPAQAAILVVLAMITVAAAVAAPVFLAAADRSVADARLAGTDTARRTIQIDTTIDTGTQRDTAFFLFVRDELRTRAFTPVFSAETDIWADGAAGDGVARLAARDGYCAHLAILAGRCASAAGEAVVAAADADMLGVRPGEELAVTSASATPDGWRVDGTPLRLSVVGTYHPRDPNEPYWGTAPHFEHGNADRNLGNPIFTEMGTLVALPHRAERQSATVMVDPRALRTLPLTSVAADVDEIGQGATRHHTAAGGQVLDLLNAIAADRAALRRVVAVAVAPLLLLGLYVIFLVVAYAIRHRQQEPGVLKLRGTAWTYRWLLAWGEAAVPLTAGAALGCVAGYRVAPLILSPGTAGTSVATGAAPVRYALAMLAASLLVAAAAVRRPLSRSVVELMRSIPGRARGGRAGVGEAVVLTAAVAAVAQLYTAGRDARPAWIGSPGGWGVSGIDLLAPGLLIAVVAVMAARLVGPLARRMGNSALRRGRLGWSLGAVQVGRRPGAAQLLTLLTLALGQLVFVATAWDTGESARRDLVEVDLGAPRTIDVLSATRPGLLSAVRQADPEGRYAMAVTSLPGGGGATVPVLAVDSTRLSRVATWKPGYGLPVDRAAALLRPPAGAQPVIVRGRTLVVDATVDTLVSGEPQDLVATVAPLPGGTTLQVGLGTLVRGRHAYTAALAVCRDGCRLARLDVGKGGGAAVRLHAVFHEIRQADPPAVLVGPGGWGFHAPAGTGSTTPATLNADPSGLTVTLDAGTGRADGRLYPADTPYPLPVVGTATVPGGTVSGIARVAVPVRGVAGARTLPRVGGSGALVDLEYADRLSDDAGSATDPQVWLSADAPAWLPERLRAAGLTLGVTHSAGSEMRLLARQGPATGLRFHLFATMLAVLMTVGAFLVVASVDRGLATADLRHLRVQGVRQATIARSGLYMYCTLMLAGAVLGAVAGLLAFAVAGWALPVTADAATAPVARLPGTRAVLLPWGIAAALALAVGTVAARAQWRAIARGFRS